MNHRLALGLLFLLFISYSYSQDNDTIAVIKKNGIFKHSVLSTHPFGIFFSRLNHNFKTHVSESSELSLSLESGNVWGPYIKTYIPDDQSIRDQMRQHAWHQRQYFVDEESISAETFEIKTDGVIKGLRANVNFKVNSTQEINVGVRTFLLTKGKGPFTILTGDGFIENFHKNIAGGDDPFDRGVYGFNQAEILYIDRNGREMLVKNGDFVFGGIEAAYYYYPEFLINKKRNLHFNIGGHLGTNLSQYNSSIDLGLTTNSIKRFSILNSHDLALGVGLGILRKSFIEFSKENMEFGTNDFLGSLESSLEYHFVSKGKTTHAFSANLYFQTSLNAKKEFDYFIPIRPENGHKSWGNGTTNLYENNNYWTFMYTFSRKIATSFYLQQDLTLNNNPDIQTGVSVRFGL